MRSASSRRRGGDRGVNIWPGFVDALAALLMVVIFVLMIFTVAQFYLSDVLSGRDEMVRQLRQQVADLEDILGVEREENADLRARFAQLSVDLQQAIGGRDAAAAEAERLAADRDRLSEELGRALSRSAALEDERALLEARLTEAYGALEADRETLELRLSEIASLEADLRALRAVRSELEGQIAALTLARDNARAEVEALGAELDETISLANLLRDRLQGSEARVETLGAELAESRARSETLSGSLDETLARLDRLRAALSERDEEADALSSQLAARAGEVEGLQSALAAAEDEQEDLAARLAEAVAYGETLAERLQAAEADRDRLRQDLAQARQQSTDLQDDLQLSNAEIVQLRDLLSAREDLLNERERALETAAARAEEAAGAADAAQSALDAAREELDGLTVQLRLTEEDRAALEQQLTALRDRSRALEARLSDERERTALAQEEIEARDVRIEELLGRLTAAQRARDSQLRLTNEAEALVAELNSRVRELEERLRRIQGALELSEDRISDRDLQIEELTQRLNLALADEVQELRQYRSEFFGRLRRVIGDRTDIRVVGDRFVFQSEVLFGTGSARLGEGGREQLAQFADTLIDIADEIPDDIDWILRVDGHTDARPINTRAFPSNWELSTARATSVVRFLIDQGVPPDRLAAAGFGAHQPLDPGDDEEAYERNRRIELKLDRR